jgi:WD40 repeat protein
VHAARVIECRSRSDGRPTVVTGVAIAPDGRSIAAATDDHAVSVWDTGSGHLRARFDGHTDWVSAVAMTPDGAVVASGANDCTVCLWSLDERRRLLQLPACCGAVADVRFHPNGQQAAVVGFAGSLDIVNVSAGQITQQLGCSCSDQRAVAFSPVGTRMAAAGRDGRIRFWNLDGVHETDVQADGRPIRALAFSPDGRWLAAAGDSRFVHILDADSRQPVVTLGVRPARVYALAFIDRQRLAVAGSDNRVRIWNLESEKVDAELTGHTGTVAALASSADGTMLVSGGYDTTLRVWGIGRRSPEATAARPGGGPVAGNRAE